MSIPDDKERFNFTLSKKMKIMLEEQAALEFRTQSALVCFILARYLKEKGYPVDVDTEASE